MQTSDIRRIALGSFTRPSQETGGAPEPGVVLGYVVRHLDGVLLFDTGLGEGDPGVDAWYQPARVPLQQALATAGVQLSEIDQVVNCHLHFDHCGGNPLLAGRPIWCQRGEASDARAVDYTLPWLVDFPGARYELLDGDSEIAPGLVVLATPGHVPGHQSLAVTCGDGTVVLAGQSHETASAFAREARTRTGGPALAAAEQASVDRILALDPARVLFAHDEAVWEPA